MESNKDLEKDAGTPFDITPSRRSSRKKQSTFSDDFEYYTPTGRKKEDDKKPSPQLTPTLKGKNKTGSQKSGDSEEEVEGSVENSLIRKKPGPKPKVGKGKPKTIVKKTAKKGLSPQKKKKAERKQNEASEDEDSSEEEDEEEGSDSDESEEDEASSGKKRKIAQGANKKVKTFKKQRKQATKDLDQEEEESSSDEEDSTPISQLQAQLKQQQAAAKGPPLAQNLAKKLLEVGAESSSGLDGEGDATPALGTKRKQAGDSKDAPPTKKTVDVSKLGSALAALAKSIPPEDLGLVKRSQSEIAAKMSKPVVKSLIKEEETSTQKNKSADIKDFKPVKPIASKHAAVDKLKQEAGISEKKPAAGVEKQTVKMEKESDVSGKPEKTKVRGTDESLSKKSKFEEQQLKNKQGKTVMTKDGKVSVLSSPKTGKESLLKKDTSGKQSTPRKLTESEIRQKKIEQIKAKIAEKSAGQRSFLEKHSSLKPLDGSVGKHVTKEGSKVLEMSKKKLDLGEAKAKSEVSSKKFSSNLASSLAKKKSEIKGHEDIFKRAILHKKKSHQPFGNKNVVKKLHDKSQSVKESVVGESNVEKKTKIEKDKRKSEEGRRKSSDFERRKSKEDKGERRLSHEGSKRQRKISHSEEKTSKVASKDTETSEPPVLTPASATKPAKHKHNKPEHEVPVDMSMMDLFKPDGLIVHDPATSAATTATTSALEAAQTTLSPTTGSVRPEDAHHVLMEHQYSKTSVAVHDPGVGDSGFNSSGGCQQKSAGGRDDMESMSHNNSVIMDVSLPEQILEESGEETVSSTQEESAVSGNGGKQDLGDRASILETLDTELKESGTDFLIVGQVEVSRQAADASNISSSLSSTSDTEAKGKQTSTTLPSAAAITRKRKDSERSSGSLKKSTDAHSPSRDKKKDKARDKKKQKKSGDKDGESKKEDDKDNEESGEDEDFEDDENDIDWEDPDMLYCLCRKPHNNRFMICCDKCEEWYHGTCVGVTRARGKEMEDNEEEYTCPICIKGDGISVLEKAPPPSKSTESPSTVSKLLQKCVGRKCSKTPRPGSVYCSNECIMNHAQESLKAIRDEHAKKMVKDKYTATHDGSEKSFSSKSSQSSLSSSDVVEVMERKTGKILRGPNAPTQKGLHRWLEQHPSFEVVQPHKHRSSSKDSRDSKDERSADRKDHRSSSVSSSSSSKGKKSDKHDDRSHHHHHHHKDSSRRQSSGGSSSREHSTKKIDGDSRRSSSSSSSSSFYGSSHRKEEKKSERSSSGGTNQIRINVRTALHDCLYARAKEAEDILLSSNEIKALALEIEEKLFDLFNDTGHKYRAKYRSLIFNIKDPKNKGLFRKILGRKINPDQLVLMSTEDLASRELAMWREQESKHQIEMIEKLEKEKLETKSTNHMTKKTHKGEIEVNDEDLSTLETRLEEKKDTESEKVDEQAQEPVIDTTSQHRAHLFDLNCKVCTGKIVPGPEEQAAPAVSKPVKAKKPGVVSFSLPDEEEEKESKRSSSSHKAEEKKEVEEEDYEKAAEIVKEALEHMHKAEEELSSLPSMVSASPKHHEPALSPPISPKEEPEEMDMDLDEDDEEGAEIITQSSSTADSAKTSVLPSSSPSPPAATAVEKKVVVRSPDSALQSGLEAKAKFTPTSPVLWKGFVSMMDVAKFFTSAYRVSGPVEHIEGKRSIPDTVHIMGRISPDHMWDYLSKIRQAGSKDITVLRFIPGSDEEKVAYIHLYSYLNSRARCGVANNPSRQVKDFYIVPLASHSKIPRTLLPFDGPGLEENRPHMLIGILVKQKDKHSKDTAADTGSPHSSSSSSHSHKASKVGSITTGSGDNGNSSSNSKARTPLPGVSRDPRLAKLAAKQESPQPNATSNSNGNNSETNPKEAQPSSDMEEEYDPEYVPAMVNAKGSISAPVAAYVPTPTAKKREKEDKHKPKAESKKVKSKTPSPEDSGDSESQEKHHHHHHHHHHNHHKERHRHHQHHKEHHFHKNDRGADEDDSEPYSPGKEAEPYSPGQEAAAEEPYDPEDESLMDEEGHPISSGAVVSTSGTTSTTAATVATTSTVSTGAVSSSGLTASTTSSAQAGEKNTEDSTNLSSEELVERMARSNDPNQISNLMVMALSQASTQHEQQQLLVKLTRQVEDRKLQLAEELQRSSSNSAQSAKANTSSQLTQKQQSETVAVSSSLSESQQGENKQTVTSEQVSKPTPVLSAAPSSNEVVSSKDSKSETEKSAPTNVLSTSPSSSSDTPSVSTVLDEKTNSSNNGGIKFTIKPLGKSPFKPVALPTASPNTSKPSATLAVPKSTPLSSSNSHPSKSDKKDAKNQPQLPEALKALMNDVMGGADTPSLEHRTKLLNKKEAESSGLGKGVDKTKPESSEQTEKEEKQRAQEMADAVLEAKKRSDDEDEARRILDSLKKNSSSTSSEKSSTVKAVEPASKPTKAPSIDELLERLKKGGFQFPLQKSSENVTVAPSAPVTSTPEVTTGGTSISAPMSTSISASISETSPVVTTSPPSLQTNPSVPTYTTSKPLFSAGTVPPFSSNNSPSGSSPSPLLSSAEDVDLRIGPPPPQKLLAPAIPATAPPNTSGSNRPARTGRISPQTLQDRDERLLYHQQDKDERAFRSGAGPKHPLDPHAFPPLPGMFGPARMPHSPGPDVPSYQPTPRSILPPKSRSQPPPPGTEFDKPAAVLGITDVDLRHPPLPPLPPQPPPPPPPLPHHQFREDVDYRNPDPYRHIHHGYNRGRGGHAYHRP